MTLINATSPRAHLRRALPMLAAIALSVGAFPDLSVAQTPQPDVQQGDGGTSAFYIWNYAIPAVPGTLLRQEDLPPQLGLPNAGAQYRILYSSTDGVGGKAPVAVSGTVFLPTGVAPAGGWPLVLWAHGTTGMADVSAPSWEGQFDVYRKYLAAWLDAGFAVVASDYQGLGVPGPHPYLNTRPEAYNVLDSARVALRTFPQIGNRMIAVGHSQGAAAAFATGGHARQYAPELNYLGTVTSGVPYASPKTAGSTANYDQDKVDPAISYMLLMMLMAQQTHPDLKASDMLTERAAPLLARIGSLSGDALYTESMKAGLTWSNSFKPDALAQLIGITMPLMEYSTLKLDRPVFIGIGADDSVALPAVQQMLVDDACAAGTTVEARHYAGADHDGVLASSLADSLAFARQLSAGGAITSTCRPKGQ